MSEEVDLTQEISDVIFKGGESVIATLNELRRRHGNDFGKAINSETEIGYPPIASAFILNAEGHEEIRVSDLRILQTEFGVNFSFKVDDYENLKNLISLVLKEFTEPEVISGDVNDFEASRAITLEWLNFLIDEIRLKPLDSAYEILLGNPIFFEQRLILNKVLEADDDKAKFFKLAMQELKNDRIDKSQLFKFFEATVSREEVEACLEPSLRSDTFLEDLSRKYEDLSVDIKDRSPGACLRGGLVTKLAEPPRPTGTGVVVCKQFRINTPPGENPYKYWKAVMWTTWTEEVASLLFEKPRSSEPRVFSDHLLEAKIQEKLARQSQTGLTFRDESGISFNAIAALGTRRKRKIADAATSSAPRFEPDVVQGEVYPNIFNGVYGGGDDDTMKAEMTKAIVMRNFVPDIAIPRRWLQYPLGFTRASGKRPVMEENPNDIHVDVDIRGKCLSPLSFVSLRSRWLCRVCTRSQCPTPTPQVKVTMKKPWCGCFATRAFLRCKMWRPSTGGHTKMKGMLAL